MYKTCEIYKLLKMINDIYHAKEHQEKEDERLSKLFETQLSLLRTLEDRGLIIREDCYRLTTRGLSLLRDYEEKRRAYGARNVEILPAMIEGKISFIVKVNSNVEQKNTPKSSQKLLDDFFEQ
jgi:predicted transcriptional regulator